MSKLMLIVKREYLERVRSRWFIIGTILGPILMSMLIIAPIMMSRLTSSETYIEIVNASQIKDLGKNIRDKLSKKQAQKTFHVEEKVVDDPAALPAQLQELNKAIDKGELNGYVVITPDSIKNGVVDYYSKNVSDFFGMNAIEDAANSAIVEQRLKQAGLDADRISELSKPIDLKRNKLSDTGAREDKGQSFVLAYVLMMIIYITTLLYGITVLRGVVEEKQSRIVEVIISSISPTELMFGKLIGIGLVGLTQFTIWSIFAAILPSAFAAISITSGAKSSFPEMPPSLLIYFIVFFLLGYFLYATLFAMAGSIISSEQDANSVQMPITMLLVIAVVCASMVLQNPNSTASIVMSMIPFFSPILMFLRITVQTPPFWQIGGSILLLLIFIVGCSWIAGKIYRVGILMYGKRPTIPELIKWLKYT